jgi:hypothetical protein
MNEARLPIPDPCQAALAAIEHNPLELSAEARAHLRGCPACAEAQVHWLALEEAPFALTPAGYFDRLPARILRKLPTRPGLLGRPSKLLWAAAALILMTGVGVSGFWLGQANRNPVVEATLPRNSSEAQELMPEAPFQENEDAMSQLSNLSQEEAEAVLKRLDAAQIGHP